MNTNSNIYTIVYSTVIVVVVAAVLAWVSLSLKPRQDANITANTISQMLVAADIELTGDSNDAILDTYAANVKEAFTINAQGVKVRSLSVSRNAIELASNLKEQNTILKKGGNLELPVYVFKKDNSEITVVPCYGAGLWGPVWGYIAVAADGNTLVGAYFDHESETPGLGAKIKDDPAFRAEFKGKTIDFNGAETVFAVKKGAGAENEVDAITGATMTSKGLSEAINEWLRAYKPYFANVAASCCAQECEAEEAETTVEE